MPTSSIACIYAKYRVYVRKTVRSRQLLDDKLILSASDLNNYLACPHLTTLDLARARGELEVEPERGADAELLARKGDEYEDRRLASPSRRSLRARR